VNRTAPDLADALVAHWISRADLDFIRQDLEQRGKDPAHLTVVDLSRHDQLHAGQLAATRDFAAWVGVPRGTRVLDLGAGLGGAARVLAADHACEVVAVELSRPLHETGSVLTQWLGLNHLVQHRCADLLDDAGGTDVDLVWLQHVDMHVPDKGALYTRVVRPLADGGRAVWHDWLAGPGGAPHYPVPWSDGGELSFLAEPMAYRQDARQAGLEITRLEHITERTRDWFAHTLAGLHRTLDSLPTAAARRRARFTHLATRIHNVLRNLDERRLIPFFGEASRSG